MADEEGISEATLYNWRKQARLEGGLFPDAGAGEFGGIIAGGGGLQLLELIPHQQEHIPVHQPLTTVRNSEDNQKKDEQGECNGIENRQAAIHTRGSA